MMDKKYSVLISVYAKERADRFASAILSMLEQTEKPDEIVVVKDGKLTDDLELIIQTFINEYPGVFKILQNETNLGLGPSLNKGIHACRNELIARMDSDDISRPDRIEKQLKMFEKDPDLSICGGVIHEFYDDDVNDTAGYRVCPKENDDIREYIRTRCPFNHMTVMYKRSEVLRAGNYQCLHYNEDYLLWIRMYEAGCKFANLNEVLVDVRVGRDMYSRRGGEAYFKSEKEIQDILLKDGIIDRSTYRLNMLKRRIVQKWMPSSVRALVFKVAARSRGFDEETK